MKTRQGPHKIACAVCGAIRWTKQNDPKNQPKTCMRCNLDKNRVLMARMMKQPVKLLREDDYGRA